MVKKEISVGGIKMSVEFWKAAELFYETVLPVVGIISGVLLLILLYAQIYAKGMIKKIVMLGSVISLITIGAYVAWGYQHYEPYLSKAKLVTPLIRDRKKGIFGYKYYSWDELRTYKRLNNTEHLRELTLYAEEEVRDKVVYLGKGPYFHYAKDQHGKIFKLEKGVVFASDVTQATMVGVLFELTHPEYEEIGFFNPERVMYEHLLIPETEKGKTFEPDYDPDVPMAKDHFQQWSF